MKYFESGLNKEQLNKAYKKLAMKWHPDVSKEENAGEIMKEINREYDDYFVLAASFETGYDAADIYSVYKKAREEREIILTFLRRDKQAGDGSWFSFHDGNKASSNGGESWKDFHGGFSVCRLTKQIEVVKPRMSCWEPAQEIVTQTLERIPMQIETPTYADMYFAMLYGEYESPSTDITVEKGPAKSKLATYDTYHRVSTKQYGDIWISKICVSGGGYFGRPVYRTFAFLKYGQQVMRTEFPLNPEYYTIQESVEGKDFGFLAFQECSRKEFYKYHDVDYWPEFARGARCKELENEPSSFYWIRNPMIEHFARRGVLKFYQSEHNFRVRFGTFDQWKLDEYLHELSIDDAEEIQDFLDDINKDFDDHIRGWIKKGKMSVKIR